MAPIINPDLITILIFLLGIFSAVLILIYSVLSPEVSDEDEEED
jgi:uncharacterized membrane protein